jgi:DNA-binding IscR family transcriptional regulator
MAEERRNLSRRADVVQAVVTDIVQNPGARLTAQSLEQWLGVPPEAAERILRRLMDSGLLREIQRGVWARAQST